MANVAIFVFKCSENRQRKNYQRLRNNESITERMKLFAQSAGPVE